MMGCSGQAETMPLYEYEERLFHWNEAHGDPGKPEPPDFETIQRILEMANLDIRLTN